MASLDPDPHSGRDDPLSIPPGALLPTRYSRCDLTQAVKNIPLTASFDHSGSHLSFPSKDQPANMHHTSGWPLTYRKNTGSTLGRSRAVRTFPLQNGQSATLRPAHANPTVWPRLAF